MSESESTREYWDGALDRPQPVEAVRYDGINRDEIIAFAAGRAGIIDGDLVIDGDTERCVSEGEWVVKTPTGGVYRKEFEPLHIVRWAFGGQSNRDGYVHTGFATADEVFAWISDFDGYQVIAVRQGHLSNGGTLPWMPIHQ